MSVDDIVRKIISDAEAEGARLKAESDRKAEALLAEAGTEAGKRRARMIESAGESIADKGERVKGMAQLEARKDLLARKREHLERVFSLARERLNELPEKKYSGLIEKQLKQIDVGDSFEIIVRPEDVDRIGRIAGRIWGDSGRYKVVPGEGRVDGGFILRTGRFEYDNTFGSLLSALAETLEAEVTEILFGKGEQ